MTPSGSPAKLRFNGAPRYRQVRKPVTDTCSTSASAFFCKILFIGADRLIEPAYVRVSPDGTMRCATAPLATAHGGPRRVQHRRRSYLGAHLVELIAVLLEERAS